MQTTITLTVVPWLSLCIFISSLQSADDQALARLQKLECEGLPNLIQVNELVYSGGLPEGESAFEKLKTLGIKTIISVDGAKPDVEMAEKFGMRYVHLPHGYDSVPFQRSSEIAKAIKTLPGPCYIHCHHGKHRSPAATAAACKTLGWISSADSMQLLKLAGTDPKYKGLFKSVELASKKGSKELDSLEVTFVSSAELPPMASCMVEIEELFDRLKRYQKNKWTGVSREKQSPQQAALVLHESFKELIRLDDERIKAREFIEISQHSEKQAERLERILRENLDASSDSTRKTESLDSVFAEIEKVIASIDSDCKRCHDTIRNR